MMNLFEYYNQISEDNQNKLIGGFLYHHFNKEPIFFKYENVNYQYLIK